VAQLSLVAARAPLTAESYRRCRDELCPGQVKRVSAGPRRVLVGYVVACPACGAARPYLDEDVGFREEAGPTLVGTDRPLRCACGLSLRVVSNPDPTLEAFAA
jgi:hypothetical protein